MFTNILYLKSLGVTSSDHLICKQKKGKDIVKLQTLLFSLLTE